MKWTLFLALGTPFFTGCTAEEEPVEQIDYIPVLDQCYLERGVLTVLPFVNTLGVDASNWSLSLANTCATLDSITGDTANFPLNGPVTYHLRWPVGGCMDGDGHQREGRLRLRLYAALDSLNAFAELLATDLSIDDFRYRFGISMTHTGIGAFSLALDSSYTWYASAWSRRCSGPITYAWSDGSTDTDPTNDIYAVGYGLNGFDRNGNSYIANTTDPLRITTGCAWITAGSADITPSEQDLRTLAYGSGGCDSHATITIGTEVIGLTIP